MKELASSAVMSKSCEPGSARGEAEVGGMSESGLEAHCTVIGCYCNCLFVIG